MRIALLSCALTLIGALGCQGPQRGNVIFLHPDGTGANHWLAARVLLVGPDGELNWDKIPHMGVYRGHMKDSLTSTSHGGATSHAYGVKVVSDSFGLDGKDAITAQSGQQMSIMEEAQAAGITCGLVNSGTITEPGTACFMASVPNRKMHHEIAAQLIAADLPVLMGGGEQWLLPEGVQGRHGKGTRTDGRNLIEEAEAAGYTVVYTRDELISLPADTMKLLGIFAANQTFNDVPEEVQTARNLPHYWPDAPTIGEMTQVALDVLQRHNKPFFLVAEEEGTDNMANNNNASGDLEALRRADDAVGVIREFLAKDQGAFGQPRTMLIMAADSDASGMQVLSSSPDKLPADQPLPARSDNGGAMDGRDGTQSLPFLGAPDRFGNRWPFAIVWTSHADVSGGIVAKAEGLNAELLPNNVDNTDVYRMMYGTLFGRWPGMIR
jgi:alkaline phosphatase